MEPPTTGHPDLSSQRDASAALSRSLKLHPLVARVLASRGITAPETARRFLSPRLTELSRPDAMADRERAAERISDAIKRNERIVVYGDYDVDGITSATLLTSVLRRLGGDVKAHVASRFSGGYGLSDVAVDRVLSERPTLVITCDCGTSDHPRLERLRSAGVDAIVVDHHKVPDEPLPALAFLNPHRPDCGFAYKHMASVGLAFSVAAAVRARLDAAMDIKPLLDLVALGTIADVAPLDGDNRILTRFGLNRIADGDGCVGVRALMTEVKLRYRLTARDVSFSIAPLLNAPGRLGSAVPTMELLLTDDPARAASLARELAEANVKRREVSATLIDAAMSQVREIYGSKLPAGIVVAGDGWHHGMGGIVAGRLVDRLGVAVAVVAMEGHEGVGSVRAPRGVKLFDAVTQCRSDLLVCGGHDGAAGLRIHRERIESFRASFANALEGSSPAAAPAERYDTELQESDLAGDLVRDLSALEPTGEANPEPRVVLRSTRIAAARAVAESHVRLSLQVGRRTVPCFVRDGVSRRERGEIPLVGARVDVIGAIRPDPWNGPEAVQLELVTIRQVA